MKEIIIMIFLAFVYCACICSLIIFNRNELVISFIIGSIIGLLTLLICNKEINEIKERKK